MTTPSEALTGICRSIAPGVRFPSWAVASRSGHSFALISEASLDPHAPWKLQHIVRATTVVALMDAGLVTLGAEELVPEYEGSKRGFQWMPGRMGRRLAITEAGRVAAGGWLPIDLP